MDGGVLGLVRIESRGAISRRLAAGLLSVAFVLLAGLALGVGFGHRIRSRASDVDDSRTGNVDDVDVHPEQMACTCRSRDEGLEQRSPG